MILGPPTGTDFSNLKLTFLVRYSGTVKEATAWHPVILDMKNQLEEKLGQKFNFVLCNWYEDGTHHIGMQTPSGQKNKF